MKFFKYWNMETLTELEILNCANCRLNVIEDYAFINLRLLHSLDLRNNLLTTISKKKLLRAKVNIRSFINLSNFSVTLKKNFKIKTTSIVVIYNAHTQV